MYETMEPTSATINFSIVTSLLLNTFTAPSIVRAKQILKYLNSVFK